MNQPISPRNRFSRRRLLAGTGGVLAAGAFAARGGLAAARPGLRPRGGDVPNLSQWYHEYGEEGVLEAVERYAEAYEEANVEVQWVPGDWETAFASALLTDDGPDVFEWVNGPNIDMILGEQVVPLDGILGDAESEFNERMLARVTFDGHLWAVPQMIDMQLLVYRKSLLEEAGLEPPTTLDELIAAAAALTTGDIKGLFLGNDGGVGLLSGMPLWSAGADFITPDNEFGFASEPVYETFVKLHELFDSDSLLLGSPDDWSSPGAFINQLTAMQLTGLWTFPQLADSDIGDDFDVMAWPAFDASTGTPSIPFAALSSTVSSRSVDVEASKAFVKWLWVDQTDYQFEFATAFGFHIPARAPLVERADNLTEGPAAKAVTLFNENGFPQNQILWTPASNSAYNDARVRMIAEGADPESQIAAVREVFEVELERVLADVGPTGTGAPASSTPPQSAPVTTG